MIPVHAVAARSTRSVMGQWRSRWPSVCTDCQGRRVNETWRPWRVRWWDVRRGLEGRVAQTVGGVLVRLCNPLDRQGPSVRSLG